MPPFSLKPVWLLFGIVFCFAVDAYAASDTADYDSKAAVVFTYFTIGQDDTPTSSVTVDQFMAQIDELSSGGYVVKPLPEIIEAFIAGKKIGPKTVALTFDGADKSLVDIALPVLEQHEFPFTVFIPSDKIGSGTYMDWDELRRLKRSPLASFGLHPANYSRLSGAPSADIKREINNSISKIRDELDVETDIFAYPFGEYDSAYSKILRNMGFKAAMGQQSGVAYAGQDIYALPRFTLTERYGDLERFQMTANALPLPVRDISPSDTVLKTLTPAIGFTVPEYMAKSLKNLSCFSSSQEKPELEIMNTRVEIRMQTPFAEERPRINCTLPVATTDGSEPRWRWFGALYTVPADLLEEQQAKDKKTSDRHASDVSDDISVE